jgi:hypothetical protein
MANVETNESLFPVRYLFRRRMRDSGGAGRFRGGTGGEYALVPHGSADGTLGFVVSGKGVDYPMGHGLGGGYPGAPGRYVIARDGMPGASPTPYTLEDVGGTHEVVSWGVYTLASSDVLYVRWNGAGGISDPRSRAPEAVAADVREGVVSRSAARELYQVALSNAGEVDERETAALRASSGCAAALSVLLPGICHACGYSAKGGFRVAERLMRELGPQYTTGPETLLRELFCPQCGAQVDAQVARKGDDVLFDHVEVT